MLDEFILGFDCREMYRSELEVKNWDDKSYLLNPNTERVLTVNSFMWQSVFKPPRSGITYQVGQWAYPSMEIPPEWMTANTHWRALEPMREFLDRAKDYYQKPCWLVGFTVVQTANYITSNEALGRFTLAVGEKLDSSWTLLGYDVEDISLFNGGLGKTWVEEYQEERIRLWGSRLNKYYLFASQDDAINYAHWHSELNPGVGLLLVFGLYRIDEIIK